MAFPWTALSCAGNELISQNGYQVLIGSVSSPAADAAAEAADQMPGMALPSGPKLETEHMKEGESLVAWWMLLVLAGSGAAAYGAYRVAAGERKAAKIGAAGAGVAAVVLTVGVLAGLPLARKVDDVKKEMAEQAASPPSDGMASAPMGMMQGMGQMVEVELRYGLGLTLLTLWGQTAIGAYLLLRKPARRSRKKKRKTRHSEGARQAPARKKPRRRRVRPPRSHSEATPV